VRAGEHTVVARADGYTPVPLTVKILGGTVSAITIPMYTDADLTRETRKMPNWVPYTLLGSGVVLGGTGWPPAHVRRRPASTTTIRRSRSAPRPIPRTVARPCRAGVADMKTSAESNQSLAFTSYAIGGAAVVAGVVLVILNRPKTFRIDPTKGAATDIAISPVGGARPGRPGGGWQLLSCCAAALVLHSLRFLTWEFCMSPVFTSPLLRRGGAAFAALAATLALAGCFESNTTTCSSGVVCPEGSVCTSDGLGCAVRPPTCAATVTWTWARPATTATRSTRTTAAPTAS
jgi:hypothetical protein